MDIRKKLTSGLIRSCIGIVALFFYQLSYAVVIPAGTVITTPTTYTNTVVDLSHGNFIVRNNATLTIANCSIIGTVSPTNPSPFFIESGKLNLTNNEVSFSAVDILPRPREEAAYHIINLSRASASLLGNTFIVDKQFSVGLFNTMINRVVNNITISNNTFQNFHGVLYILNASNTFVDGNVFRLNSNANILLLGSHSKITNNSIYFSGLQQLGDAIDVINSEDITVAKNVVFTPTSQGISILASKNVSIDQNTITGGITYAINLLSNTASAYPNKVLKSLGGKLKYYVTSDITISNNFMSQNRYGIAATDVNNLAVVNNYFSQRFPDAATRKFWTNNEVLLKNVTSLTWVNNYYKEAFTQLNEDNVLTNFVEFPATGGVVL